MIYTFGSTPIPYSLIRSHTAKTIKIIVEFENGVEIVVPQDFDEAQLLPILHSKAPWILKKLRELETITPPLPAKELVSGEKFLFLGHHYLLIVRERAERQPFTFQQGNELTVTIKPSLKTGERYVMVRNTLRDWYIRQAGQKLPEQIARYAPKLNVYPEKVAVLDLDKSWGSCTPRGTINLNWRLVMAPIPIIDYIAVHELGHLLIPDHSSRFWTLVRTVLPDYEQRREWLRMNGPTLTL